jgi:hypothetical protein
MIMTEKGTARAPILVAPGAPPATVQAAGELAVYIEKISGARPQVTNWANGPLQESAIWVGVQSNMPGLDTTVKIEFNHPEEILLACDGRNIIITGRDRMVGTNQVEYGTANAVYTFIQKYLGVRWFQPWDKDGLWTDIIKRETVTLPEFVYRFHPPFRERLFWPSRPDNWERFQRLKLGSYKYNGGHGFTDWWEKYHQAHPDYFALRSDGTRTPESWGGKPNPEAVKLCDSNPQVWTQWLENAEAMLRADPTRITVSASPNDGGGYCTCEKCRAWDHPNGPLAGADRYVKVWNILARGLKARFPDRDVWVGAYAYSAYKDPPIAETLEKNIAIGYVGHFPLANDAVTEKEKAAWKAWSGKASCMIFRPNLFHYSGGFLGLPSVAMRRTIRDFRFLADNKCIGLQVDGLPHCFQTQGVEYYLMIQLAYDPYQDGEALLKDYYKRAFGPAAGDIEAYFDLMEKAHDQILNTPGFRHSSGAWRELIDTCRRVYTPDMLAEAETLLKSAAAKAAEGPECYRLRVEEVRKGLEFTKLQVEIMHVMKQVRDSKGKEREEAIRKATELCEQRDKKEKAGVGKFPDWYKKRVRDYMGPPTEELVKAAQYPEAHFLPASWKLAWADDFDRAELGADWQVLKGSWSVKDGQLVTTGGSLLTTRKFPGLQRLEFRASVTPNPGISDLSPFIHCGPAGHSSGYLLQFGGNNNSVNSIQRKGNVLAKNSDVRIEAGKVYTIVAEFDGSTIRLTVDGKIVMQHADPQPLVGPANEQVGFYVHEGAVKIDQVKVFTSRAVTQD